MSVSTLFSRLVGDFPLTGQNIPLTKAKFAELFKAYPSFVDYFPVVDYTPESKTFLLDDGISRGVVFRVWPADTDGRSDEAVASILEKIDNAIRKLVKFEDHPYVCQIFLEDRQPDNIADLMEQQLAPNVLSTQYTKVWLKEMREHFDMMRSPNGIYPDERIVSSGQDEKGWRAIDRQIHICLYRKAPEKVWNTRQRYTAEQQINKAVKAFVAALGSAQVSVKRYNDNDLRNWLLPWLTPKVPGYESAYDYLKKHPLPERSKRTAGWDLGEQIIHAPPAPIADKDPELDRGTIKLGDTYMRYVTLQGLDSEPEFGLMTQDTKMDEEVKACKFDQMPSETIMVWTIVPRDQQQIDTHLESIKDSSSKSASVWAAEAEQQAKTALEYRRHHSEIYQLQVGYFLRAETLAELDDKRLNADNIISQTPMRSIVPEHDLIADDAVIRNLPFIYDWNFDKNHGLRSRLTFTAHIAATLPFFGRGLGGSLGYIMYKRDGQVYTINPFKDKKRVAHKVLFGPSGSGKSNTFVTQTAETMALERPRQIIIEKGNSFDPLMQFYEAHGIQVSRKQFSMDKSPSFPPYFETEKALMELRGELPPVPDDEDDERRSYIGEMLSITQLMVTGGKENAEKDFKQSSKSALQDAVIAALEAATERGDPHARPQDVYEALIAASEKEKIEKIQLDIREMADSIKLWTSGIRSRFFNTHGVAFNDEDDVTHIDLGILIANDNEDMLQVAILSLVFNISAMGERHQYSGRHIEVLVDEGHYLAQNQLAADSLTTGVKVWRKLNAWLTIATQNFGDYKDDAKKILEQAEFWTLLCMSPSEAEQVSRFKKLTEEQENLVLQSKKEPGNYVEGVVMCEAFKPSLVRFVPPALGFALGQTDGKEKAARRDLMKSLKISELEAVHLVAEQIKKDRRAYALGELGETK